MITTGAQRVAVIVEGLVQHAPALIRRAYQRSRLDHRAPQCTRMAWLAHDVLRRFEVASEPIDTIASAWNHHFATWLQSGVDHPAAYRHTNDPFVLTSLGFTDEILTHLLVHVPATGTIIDLDCWQLTRPSRGIQLPAAIALSWDGQQAQYETPTGSVLQYRPWPAECPAPSMESRHDWTFGNFNFGPLSKAIARRIGERAGHHRPWLQ